MPTEISARLLPISQVSSALAAKLFAVFDSAYDCVEESRFRADLTEKDWLILLEDDDGNPRGFSTQKLLQLETSSGPVRALFSGDTIIEPASWGTQALARAWCHLAGALSTESPAPLYWFLISKGHRTYLYLPVFFESYLPQPQGNIGDELVRLRDLFATKLFGPCYDASTGLIRFPESLGQLKTKLSEVPAHRQTSEHVQLFETLNPDHAQGVELACLAPLRLDNLKHRARIWFEAGRALGPPPR